MLNKVKEYFEQELTSTARFFENNSYLDRNDVIDNALQRMLGVVIFAQEMGVPYVKVAALYGKYKNKMEEIRG